MSAEPVHIPRLAILVQSASHNRLHALVSLVSTASALQGDTIVLLTHEALKCYLEQRLNDTPAQFVDPEYLERYEAAREAETLPDLEVMLAGARDKGQVRLFGCQASIQLWRQYSAEQLSRLDAIIGHFTFLQMSVGRQLLFI